MAGFKLIQEQVQKPAQVITYRMWQPAVGLEVRPERKSERELPAELLETVGRLIASEDQAQPMTDSELAAAADREMGCDGTTTADIAFARKQLGLGTSDGRRE